MQKDPFSNSTGAFRLTYPPICHMFITAYLVFSVESYQSDICSFTALTLSLLHLISVYHFCLTPVFLYCIFGGLGRCTQSHPRCAKCNRVNVPTSHYSVTLIVYTLRYLERLNLFIYAYLSLVLLKPQVSATLMCL